MIPLSTVFWGLVFFFGLIGALRGWAKEILVSFSVLLALFIQQVFGQFVLGGQSDFLPPLLAAPPGVVPPDRYNTAQFYICVGLLSLLSFFGYASPPLAQKIGAKIVREKLQEGLLGFFLGLLNGYLIAGMLWFYISKTGYTVWGIQEPQPGTASFAIATTYLLPNWLTVPALFVAVALAFVFVIIVFV
jgi:hypothetical protein